MVLTPLATSVLALLCERPMHPYEMYRLMIKRHEDRVVKLKPGSLYHTMDRLHAAGFVVATGTEREGARPERTTYAITSAGREALGEWVRTALAEPVNEYPRLPVALAEAHHLPRAEVIELLRTRIARVEAGLIEDEAIAGGARACGVPEVYVLDMDFRIETTRAELGWLRRLVSRLENEELTWPNER
ncbi:PadR family transcriptional regulator [Pseudonocardia thermophila]|uniref:PadR family transcriptional regulator n=1 Tax=Pseudonocardia thermophila TaxID=1848 RepID=UPI001F1844E8|nr:PadR family transcriptional regulator [Pseudonocardia thermophila]